METVRTEKEYVDRFHRDSVYVHDSVFVRMGGDTIFLYKYRNIYKDRYIRDTAYINLTDSVQVPYPVEKPLSKWQNFKLQVGGFALAVIVAFVLIVVGKIVYKLRKK